VNLKPVIDRIKGQIAEKENELDDLMMRNAPEARIQFCKDQLFNLEYRLATLEERTK